MRRLVMVVVLIVAFALSAVITIYLIFRTGATRVPSIVGKSQTEAQALATKAGLRVKIQLRPDATVPKNQVIESRPIPNSSVKKDSTVVIVVSDGPAPRTSLLDLPLFQNAPGVQRPSASGLGLKGFPPREMSSAASRVAAQGHVAVVVADRLLLELGAPFAAGASVIQRDAPKGLIESYRAVLAT